MSKTYFFLLGLSLLFTIATIATLVPASTASMECFLGYKAFCSFSPFSTLLCGLFAAMTCTIRKAKFSFRKPRSISKKVTVLVFGCVAIMGIGALSAGYVVPQIQGGDIGALGDGRYRGTSSAFGYFKSEVSIDVRDGRLVSVHTINNRSTLDLSSLESELPERIVTEQSTSVDAITGATFSSHVFMNAVQNAVEAAHLP